MNHVDPTAETPMDQLPLEWVCLLTDTATRRFIHLPVLGWTGDHGETPLVYNSDGIDPVTELGVPWRAYRIDLAGLRRHVQTAMLTPPGGAA